jgi:hypothetical protein
MGLSGSRAFRGADRCASCIMSRISYRGYRFPLNIIQRAVWLCGRFTLSFRDVEDMLAELGIEGQRRNDPRGLMRRSEADWAQRG